MRKKQEVKPECKHWRASLKQNKFQNSNNIIIFGEIENNIRENGFGDATVNKNMKFLVKAFYNILLKCESFNKNTEKNKQIFLNFGSHERSVRTDVKVKDRIPTDGGSTISTFAIFLEK